MPKIEDMIRSGSVAYGIGIDFPDKEAALRVARSEYSKIVNLVRNMQSQDPKIKMPEINLSFSLS